MTDKRQIEWATKMIESALLDTDNYAGKVTLHFKQQRILQLDVEPTILATDIQEAKSILDKFSKIAQVDDAIFLKKRPDGRFGGSQKKVLKPTGMD